MKVILLILLVLFSVSAQAKEDLYGDNIPFITAKYCKDFLSELHAAATIKEGLEALAGVSSAKRIEVCAEDFALRWEKYPKSVEEKPSLSPNDPLFYKNLEPKEKAKALIGRTLIINHGIDDLSTAVSSYSFKISEKSEITFKTGSGIPYNISLNSIIPLTPTDLAELNQFEFPFSELKDFIAKWKGSLKRNPGFYEAPLTNEDYKSRRLLARYTAFLKHEDRNKTMAEFCEEYQQEQELDRKADASGNRRFNNNSLHSWNLATQHGLTEGQLRAIYEYTGSYYRTINSKLRTPESMSESEKYYVQKANRALEKAPAFQGKVMRVATLPNYVLDEHQEGKVVTYASFTSTSKRSGWSWPGAQRFLIFSAKNGRLIQNFSQSPDEEEVLFLPNTKFKILKRSPDPTNPDKINFIMAETDEEGNVIADIPEELKK